MKTVRDREEVDWVQAEMDESLGARVGMMSAWAAVALASPLFGTLLWLQWR